LYPWRHGGSSFSRVRANCRAGAKEIEAEDRNFTALKAIQVAEVVIEQDL